jgi:hypothetical protein
MRTHPAPRSQPRHRRSTRDDEAPPDAPVVPTTIGTEQPDEPKPDGQDRHRASSGRLWVGWGSGPRPSDRKADLRRRCAGNVSRSRLVPQRTIAEIADRLAITASNFHGAGDHMEADSGGSPSERVVHPPPSAEGLSEQLRSSESTRRVEPLPRDSSAMFTHRPPPKGAGSPAFSALDPRRGSKTARPVWYRDIEPRVEAKVQRPVPMGVPNPSDPSGLQHAIPDPCTVVRRRIRRPRCTRA